MADLQLFAENVWIADGPKVWDTGILFTTRMTMVKLADGSIWIESPVPVSFDTLQRIAELGPIKYLLAATPRHYWRLDSWHSLFPDAQLWVSRPTVFTLKKGDLPLTGILTGTPPEGWADDFDQLDFESNQYLSEVLFFHKESHTLILDDIIQIHEIEPNKPVRNAIMRFGGIAEPYGGVSRDIRLTFLNRKAARRSLEKLLSWDFDKVIIAHGPCIENDAKQFVQRAFRWLAH